MNHRKINHLLNTELSAVETYEQALQEKEWKVLSPDPQIQALFHIVVDHVQAASQLATEVQRLGGRPVNGPKTWDSLSHCAWTPRDYLAMPTRSAHPPVPRRGGHRGRRRVALSGYAARDEDRERALQLAGSVSGVRLVEDDMCTLEVDRVVSRKP